MILSFVVAIYNVEAYLEECLSSLASQKMPDMEVYLVDDGSTDSSGEICDRYAACDPRFHVIHQQNQGLSAARNAGLDRAKGEWVFFVDGDDVVEADFTAQLHFEEYRGSDLVFLGYTMLRNGKMENAAYPKCARGRLSPENQSLAVRSLLNEKALSNDDWIPSRLLICVPWAKLYRLEFLNEHHLRFDTAVRFPEDELFNFQVHMQNPVCYADPVNSYIYRLLMGGPSASERYRPNIVPSCKYVAKAMVRELEAAEKMELYSDDLKHLHILVLRRCCKLDFLNPNNPKPYRKKRREFLALRNEPEFSASFHNVDLSNYGLMARIRVLLTKYRCFGLYLLAWRILIRRKTIL